MTKTANGALRVAQTGWGAAALGAIAMTLASATPAAAISADQCAAQSGTIAARAVAVSQGETITLYQMGDGTVQGSATLEVFCRARDGSNLGPVENARVRITVTPEDGITVPLTVSGVGVLPPGTNPAFIGPFTGPTTFRITAPEAVLPPGVATLLVGTHVEVVVQAWGGSLTDPSGATLRPGTFGDILAQTPELSSLALFGSGAAGLGGYALMRFRSRRRKGE